MVTDGTAAASVGFTWNVTVPLSLVPIGTLQNKEGDTVTFNVKAHAGAGTTLTYAAAGFPMSEPGEHTDETQPTIASRTLRRHSRWPVRLLRGSRSHCREPEHQRNASHCAAGHVISAPKAALEPEHQRNASHCAPHSGPDGS